MKIIQLSDLHLRGDGLLSYRVANTKVMLENCIAHIQNLAWKPDAIVITGDLVEAGQLAGYELLKNMLAGIKQPIYLLPGNHDHCVRLLETLPSYCPAEATLLPHLCYSLEATKTRLIFLDSTAPKSHSGHLKEKVAEWLEQKLAAQPEKPTLIFTHHPPFLTYLGKMDEEYENAEIFHNILSKHKNVRLCCGHMHRNIVTSWAGNIALTCPAVSMQIELDISPNGGGTFRMETPGYLVHHFENGFWNTHSCQIPGLVDFSGPHPFAAP